MYTRMYARVYACMIEENRTHDQHTTGTQHQRTHQRNTRPPEKRGTPATRKDLHISLIAANEKKV